jgi:Glutaredoxin-like domain (DUF836)
VTEVLLLTQPACQLCDHANDVLRRLSAEYALTVRYVSFASAEGTTLAMRHRLLFAPGVLLDDEPFSYGRLSERRLRRELARRTVTSS